MEKETSKRITTYAPVAYKTFAEALNAFFENELLVLSGNRFRMTAVNTINDMVAWFFPDTTQLKSDQTPWVTVSVESKDTYGKMIKDTELVSIVLGLVQDVDARERVESKKVRDVRRRRPWTGCAYWRMSRECMTAAELAVPLKMSAVTVGKYISQFEEVHGVVLPPPPEGHGP